MHRSITAAGFFLVFPLGAVLAETNPPPVDVVVTGTRVGKDIQSVPSVVHRMEVSRSDELQGTRTVPALLQGLPSVMVQKTAYGQGSPYLRGLTGYRNLMMIEGVRLNNSVFRDGPNQYWNTVDPLSIEHQELVMGPASVLYGSDAVGGTLNAMAMRPPEYAGAPVWQRRLYYRGATAERSHVGRVQIGGRPAAGFGFTGGVSLKDFGDLQGGREVGRQEHTGYAERDLDFRADWDAGEDASLSVGHQSVRQDDAWRTHRTIYGIDWEGLKKGDDKVHSYDQQRELTWIKGRRENMGGRVAAAEWTLSRQGQGEDLYRVLKDDQSNRQGFDVQTWGASLQLESGSPLGRWVYGAEYYRDDVDSYSRKYAADGSLQKKEIQGPVADEAAYDTAGLYAEDTLSLAGGKLDVVPGMRYSHARANADRVKDPLTGQAVMLEEDWNAVVGSFRVLYPLAHDRSHVLFAGVAQGFRAPNLSDLTRLDLARSNEIETPAPDLGPERYVEYEIGIKSRFERFSAQACYYHTRIDGMIIRAPTGRVIEGFDEVTKKNAGDGYIHGMELMGRFTFTAHWSGWISGTLMDGKVDAYPTSESERQRDSISRLMPPTTQVGLRWQEDGGRYWCEVQGDAAAKADTLSAEDRRDTQRIPPGGTPAYAVCHIRTGARVAKGLSVTAALENLFDIDYRIHGSGVNEAGRNLVVTAAYAF